jgi:hypothetical protein
MALANYTDLQAAIASWLNRADLSAQIPDFIKLAEGTLNSVVKSTYMVGTGNVSVNSNVQRAAVPADFLEAVYLQVLGAPNSTLEQVAPSQLVVLRRARLRTAGTPRFFAVIGRNFEFAPVPSSTTTVEVTYYQRIPPLASNATNWLLTNYPDLYLYASLLHAAPFLMDDQRSVLFSNSLAAQIQLAVKQNSVVMMDDGKVPGFSLPDLKTTQATVPGNTFPKVV